MSSKKETAHPVNNQLTRLFTYFDLQKNLAEKPARDWNCTLRLTISVGSLLLPPVKLITSKNQATFKDDISWLADAVTAL